MDKVIVWWVYWSWKTTIIQNLCEQNKNIWNFSYWENLRRIGKEKGFIKEDSQYQTLAEHIRQEIISLCENTLQKLIKEDLFNILLFDNHYSIIQENKLIKTFAKEKIERYKKMVLIESDANEVKRRIDMSNKSRANKWLDLPLIQEQISFEREVALELSNEFNKPLLIINNSSIDGIEKNLLAINSFLFDE